MYFDGPIYDFAIHDMATMIMNSGSVKFMCGIILVVKCADSDLTSIQGWMIDPRVDTKQTHQTKPWFHYVLNVLGIKLNMDTTASITHGFSHLSAKASIHI